MSRKRVLTLYKDSESIDSTKFQEDHKISHLEVVKRIFRYIKGTQHLGDVVDRKSTSRICTFMGSCLTSWFLKKQTSLANSITESDYVAAERACQQGLWMKQAFMDYNITLNEVPILRDDKCAIDLTSKSEIWDKVKEPLSLNLNEDEYSICCENTTHMMNTIKEARMESREMLLSIHYSLKMLLDIISKMNRKLEDGKIKRNDKGKEKVNGI
ncbi:hypothetical protein Tco_1476820 [Tanacetum coccineum]